MKPKISLRLVTVTLLLLVTVLAFAAQVAAQDDQMFVTIARVDSAAFPEVSVYVSVADGQGAPFVGLTRSRFSIKEEDDQVELVPTDVQNIDSLSLHLALALDVSMEEAELDKVKQAALALLNVLEPDDEVALLIFYEEVEIQSEFSSDVEALREIIEGLEVKGEKTSLYEAAFEAAIMTSKIPSGRKAVIILSNYEDNMEARSSQDVLDVARAFEFPIYTLGFGTEFQADPFQDMLGLVGGRMFCHYDLDEMQTTVQNLAHDLRKGYRVTFTSTLQADRAEHSFQVDVNRYSQSGQAEARLVAFPGPVTVVPSGVPDGWVAGTVELGAQASGPGEIVSMTYFVDGERLAESTESPSQVSWDSSETVEGSHIVTIQAVDSAGNQGEASMCLNVAPPPRVAVFVKPEQARLGESLTIEAQVDSPAGVTGVSFWLEDELLAQDDTPPFTLDAPLDEAKYTAGQYAVTVQADDRFGQSGRASHTVELSAPPAPVEEKTKSNPIPKLAAIVAILASLLALILIPFVILRSLLGALRKRYQQRYHLTISNLGNVIGFYELRAQEPTEELNFKFSLNGTPLRYRQEAISMVSDTPAAYQPMQEAGVPVPAQSAPVQAAGGEQEPASDKMSVAKKGAKSADRLMGLGSTAASALNLLGGLLPGTLGGRLKGMSTSMRQKQMGMSRTVRAPQQMKRTTEQLTQKVKPKSVGSATEVTRRSSGMASRGSGNGPVQPPIPEAAQMTVTKGNGRSGQADWAESSVVYQWAQTPSLEPGETLDLNLYVSPVKSSQSGYYSFDIISRLIEPTQDQSTLLSHENKVHRGQFHSEGLSLLARFWFVLSNTFVFAVCSLGVWILLSMLFRLL